MPATDFLKWVKVIDDLEWHTPNYLAYMLAQVCQEIRRIWLSLGGKGELPPLEEFLVKFVERGKSQPVSAPEKFTKGGIETGDPLDEKWQRVNDAAKARWGVFIHGPSAA